MPAVFYNTVMFDQKAAYAASVALSAPFPAPFSLIAKRATLGHRLSMHLSDQKARISGADLRIRHGTKTRAEALTPRPSLNL